MGYLVFDLPVLVVRSFSVQYIGRFAAIVHVHLGLVHRPIGSHVHKMTTGQFC